MTVITIRGQYGSGAPEIGKLLAAELGCDYVDREIIADIAAKLNATEQSVEKQEMPPTGLVKRIVNAIEHAAPPLPDTSNPIVMMNLPLASIPLDDTSYLTTLESVIKKLVSGGTIVIRGRGSQFILKDHPGAVHILTVAPLEQRIDHIKKIMDLDEKSAAQKIQKFDGSRREFIKKYFKADLEDPVHYDLVINTGHLDYKSAAAVVMAAVSQHRFQPG